MSKVLKNSLLGILSISFLLPFTMINQISAQAYRGLILDQFRFDIEADPGDVITKSFTITHDYQPNEDNSAKTVNLLTRARNFQQSSDAGVPEFIEPGTIEFNASLADWISLDRESFSLNSQGQIETISFTIKVPETAEPGGKYAAILIGNTSGDESVEIFQQQGSSGLGINSELGPLIFLTVSGDISKNLELVDIFTTNLKRMEDVSLTLEEKKTSFFTNPPVLGVIVFRNSGNVHVVPRGIVTVHRRGEENLGKPIATYQLNPNKSSVLPNSTRPFVITWGENDTEPTTDNEDFSGRRSFIVTERVDIRGDLGQDIRLKPSDEDYMNYPVIDTSYQTKYDWDHLSKLRMGNYSITVQYDYEKEDGSSSPTIIASADFTVIPWQIILLIAIPVSLLLMYLFYKFKRSRK